MQDYDFHEERRKKKVLEMNRAFRKLRRKQYRSRWNFELIGILLACLVVEVVAGWAIWKLWPHR